MVSWKSKGDRGTGLRRISPWLAWLANLGICQKTSTRKGSKQDQPLLQRALLTRTVLCQCSAVLDGGILTINWDDVMPTPINVGRLDLSSSFISLGCGCPDITVSYRCLNDVIHLNHNLAHVRMTGTLGMSLRHNKLKLVSLAARVGSLAVSLLVVVRLVSPTHRYASLTVMLHLCLPLRVSLCP